MPTSQRFFFYFRAIVLEPYAVRKIYTLGLILFLVLETVIWEGASDDFLHAGYELCLFVAR